jgi:carboxysome peptide A
MKIVKVLKPLVSTNRIPDFEHKHLQVVQDGSSKAVAVDAVGATPGDWVICVGSSAAREAAGSKAYPSDLTIVGIIDDWDEEA